MPQESHVCQRASRLAICGCIKPDEETLATDQMQPPFEDLGGQDRALSWWDYRGWFILQLSALHFPCFLGQHTPLSPLQVKAQGGVPLFSVFRIPTTQDALQTCAASPKPLLHF